MGSIMPATTNATRNGEPVNCSMSQPLVSICMEKAVKVRKPAVQYMRNWPDLITPSGWSLRMARTGRLVRVEAVVSCGGSGYGSRVGDPEAETLCRGLAGIPRRQTHQRST